MPKLWSAVQAVIMEKAIRDEAYRRELRENPVRIAEDEHGERFPQPVKIGLIESGPDNGYILLPRRDADSGELPDSVHEDVAGGAASAGRTFPRGGSDGNHIETMRRPVPGRR